MKTLDGIFYTPLIKRALDICFRAHRDQRDKCGLPYVFHPFHLAEQMETEEEICVALLHDVIEDSEYTFKDLRKWGFPEVVLEAVACMTREKGMPYMEYICKIRENPIARKVKLADLAHNSNLARLDTVTERDRARVRKYRVAEAILLEADKKEMKTGE